MQDVKIKSYGGDNDTIGCLYQADAAALGQEGYRPIAQSWAPNRWGFGRIFMACALCFIIIGIPLLAWMFADSPGGTLTVIYKRVES